MKDCCGPFKRGKPAKAKNPNQQCFVDCCGNLCPPDNCCDSVKLYYECGCNCDCVFNGYNFTGLVFKRRKKRKKRGMPDIPTFSKSVLEANGFTFAMATVPGPPSSSSSSSSDCCSWDGNTYIKFPPECGGLTEDIHFEKIGPNEWYSSGQLSCGDTYHAIITCDPYVEYSGPDSCLMKWSLDLTIDCAKNLQVLNQMIELCTCNAPPVWRWTADLSDCGCCKPPSSSSSSSSCECRPVEINITTSGCCLYMLPDGIEAVGDGTVTASYLGTGLPDCDVAVLLNGSLDSVAVSDGDPINVEIQVIGNCECCETQRDCVSPSQSLWVQKSNKDRKTIVLDKAALIKKVKIATERVRGRRKP